MKTKNNLLIATIPAALMMFASTVQSGDLEPEVSGLWTNARSAFGAIIKQSKYCGNDKDCLRLAGASDTFGTRDAEAAFTNLDIKECVSASCVYVKLYKKSGGNKEAALKEFNSIKDNLNLEDTVIRNNAYAIAAKDIKLLHMGKFANTMKKKKKWDVVYIFYADGSSYRGSYTDKGFRRIYESPY